MSEKSELQLAVPCKDASPSESDLQLAVPCKDRPSYQNESSAAVARCEQDTLESLCASSEWRCFLKAATKDAALIEKLRQGAMTSWVARQHSARWFERIRASKSFPAKEKSALLSLAQKKGGALVKCLLVTVWNIPETRLKLEKWANKYEGRLGMTGTAVEKVQERQEDTSWDPGTCAMYSVGVSALAWHFFGISSNLAGFISVGLFCVLLMAGKQRVAQCIAPLKASKRARALEGGEQPRGGVARTTRREQEKEEGKALRARKQRERRATAAAERREVGIVALQSQALDDNPIDIFFEEQSSSSSSPVNGSSSGSEIVEAVEVDDGLCVCCLSNEALFVVNRCGHCVFCRACRRKIVHEMRHSTGQANIKRHDLQNRELMRTKVLCPLCRQEGFIVEKSSYHGTVILP
mmetsp:Transcript_103390/g.170163  ORF Transcript_103390/g.170163 Transcript_103390/m.170163 type:complete len:409 (-) Transcript_103390:122-1348(-)